MKKLMKTVAAAAVALVASSSFASLPSPTAGFEDLTAGKYTVSQFVTMTDAGASEGSKYWYAITNASQDASAELATIVEGGAAIGCGNKYLSIDAQAPLYRTINDSSSSGGYGAALSADAEDIPASGIYLDTMVKFTVSSDEFKDGDLDYTADKLAITCYSADDSNVTNMLVRAGYVSGRTITPTNYLLNLPDGFNADNWYRLTVRAIADTGSQFAPVGFAIYIDGELLKYDVAQKAGDNEYETAIANNSVIATYLYNQEEHAFFPSLVSVEYNAATTLSAVGFKGTGCLDNIAFLAEKPDVLPDEGILVTIESLEGVSSVTVTVGQQTIEGDNGVYTLPTGTDAFTLAVDWDSANGYTSGTIMQGESSISAGTVNVSDGTTITLKGNRANFAFVDGNGDSVTASTLADALARVGNGETITLAYSYDVTTEGESKVYALSNKEVTLDLHGETITGGANSEEALFTVNEGATLTVIDTVGGGKIVDATTYAIFLVDGDAFIGSTEATDKGVTIDGILSSSDSGSDITIVRGNIDATKNSDGVDVFVALGSACSAEPVDGYWVVAPSAQPEPTQIQVPTAATTLVYDGTEQTGVEAGTGYTLSGDFKATNAGEYTAIATPATGYSWSDGSTEATNIVWSIAKAQVTATVSLTVTEATYDSTKTTVTDYTTPSVNFGLDAPELVENTDYTVAWSATEVTGAGTFTYTVSPVAGSNYTFTEASATLTITAGSEYPTYIDGIEDATAKAAYEAKYNTWKTTYGADTSSEHEAAFLLNIDPAAADQTLEPASITMEGGKVVISANQTLTAVNGKVYVKVATTLAGLASAEWTEVTLNEGKVQVTPGSSDTAGFYKIKVDF